MIPLWLALASAQDLDLEAEPPPIQPAGHRISGFGGSHGVGLAEQLVVGGDGGTSITTVDARIVADRWTVRLALPFAAYRVPGRRDTDLGNLRLEALYALEPTSSVAHALGLSAQLNPGGAPYTWATRADEVWPGFGLDGIWELRSTELGSTTLLGRGSLGIHSSAGYGPVQSTWARLSVSAAADQALGQIAGLAGELSVSYWEITPVELSGLVRVDPTEGLRLRAGVVLPLFTWFGVDPVGRPGGVREATLALDVRAAF